MPGPDSLTGREPPDGWREPPRPLQDRLAELRLRLDRLPPGHPSGPAGDDDRGWMPAAEREKILAQKNSAPDHQPPSPESARPAAEDQSPAGRDAGGGEDPGADETPGPGDQQPGAGRGNRSGAGWGGGYVDYLASARMPGLAGRGDPYRPWFSGADWADPWFTGAL